MLWPGDEATRRAALVRQAATLSRDGVDYLQVREKDLAADDLGLLVGDVVAAAQAAGVMKVLVNGSISAALEAGADGVHLPAAMAGVSVPEEILVSVSCHALDEVCAAAARGVDLILFGPVFGKQVRGEDVSAGVGLGALREAVKAARGVPVIALGGVTRENQQACIDAGAAGVAGIRMFLDVASE